MSDARLRELERQWKATGQVEDEAAYLLARLHSGELGQEHLELAGYCDRPAALLALGARRSRLPLKPWASGLRRFGGEAATRGALAAARAATATVPGGTSHELVLCALASAQAWIRCPCEAHALAAREASNATADAVLHAALSTDPTAEAAMAAAAAADEAALALGWGVGPGRRGIERGPMASVRALSLVGVAWPADVVRERIERDVAAWALGLGVPFEEPSSSPA